MTEEERAVDIWRRSIREAQDRQARGERRGNAAGWMVIFAAVTIALAAATMILGG